MTAGSTSTTIRWRTPSKALLSAARTGYSPKARRGGRRAALFYTLIETAKLNGVDPHAYLTHVLTKLPMAKAKDLNALLPWNYRPQPPPNIVLD